MSLVARNDWVGPDNVTTLQGKLRDLHADINACTDLEQLQTCVGSYEEIMSQAWVDHEEWYISARINISDKIRDLTNKEEKRYGINYESDWRD